MRVTRARGTLTTMYDGSRPKPPGTGGCKEPKDADVIVVVFRVRADPRGVDVESKAVKRGSSECRVGCVAGRNTRAHKSVVSGCGARNIPYATIRP